MSLLLARLTCYAETPTYQQVHASLRRRGPASAHPCGHCGRRADEWASLGPLADLIAGHNASGRVVWYSPHLDQYTPLCRSCHRRADRERARERRAVAALLLSPIPRRAERPRRTVAPAPVAPPALFDGDAAGAWTIPEPDPINHAWPAVRRSDAPAPSEPSRPSRRVLEAHSGATPARAVVIVRTETPT